MISLILLFIPADTTGGLMKQLFFLLTFSSLVLISSSLFGESPETRLINEKTTVDDTSIDARYYKAVGNKKLQVHIFYPDGYDKTRNKPYPVALSFHGGAWSQGPIEWGHSDAQYFTSLGFVGIAVEYRLAGDESNTALDGMKDANSSVRWVRKYASDLAIDPHKVLVVGHSSGGHFAISTAMFPSFKENSEDETISSIPDTVWAFAPAVDLTRDRFFQNLLNGAEKAKHCSPIRNIRPGLVPIHIIQGTKDELLPISTTRKFVKKMKKAGNPVTFLEYESGNHGFFYEDPAGIEFCRKWIEEKVRESKWLEN